MREAESLRGYRVIGRDSRLVSPIIYHLLSYYLVRGASPLAIMRCPVSLKSARDVAVIAVDCNCFSLYIKIYNEKPDGDLSRARVRAAGSKHAIDEEGKGHGKTM